MYFESGKSSINSIFDGCRNFNKVWALLNGNLLVGGESYNPLPLMSY